MCSIAMARRLFPYVCRTPMDVYLCFICDVISHCQPFIRAILTLLGANFKILLRIADYVQPNFAMLSLVVKVSKIFTVTNERLFPIK